MPDNPAPHRRYLRFGLRTMFVVLTVFSVWLGWQANWIRQRHELLARHTALFRSHKEWSDMEALVVDSKYLKGQYGIDKVRSPWPLWLLGEPGAVRLEIFEIDHQDWVDDPSSEDYEEYNRARRLFPEAVIVLYLWPKDPDNYRANAPAHIRKALGIELPIPASNAHAR